MRDRTALSKLLLLCQLITIEVSTHYIAPDKLNLKHHDLIGVPSDFVGLPEDARDDIRKLILSHNNLTSLKKDEFSTLSRFHNLRYLFLDHNRITDVEHGVFAQVPNLKYLELSHNGLSGISDGMYEDLARMESLRFVNLKRNPIVHYKNIDKLVSDGVQVDYDGILGRKRRLRMRSLRLGEEEEKLDDSDEETNGTRIPDKPVKAFVVDTKLNNGADTGLKINNNFLGSIIFNFLAAFLVLIALPIAMIIYYLVHRKNAIS